MSTFVLFIHLLAATVWVGGHLVLAVAFAWLGLAFRYGGV